MSGQYINHAPVKNVTSANANTHTHTQSWAQAVIRKSGAFQLDKLTNYERWRAFDTWAEFFMLLQRNKRHCWVIVAARECRIDQISMAITAAPMPQMPFAFKVHCLDAFSANMPMTKAKKTLVNKRKCSHAQHSYKLPPFIAVSVRICLLFSKICHDSRLWFRRLCCLRRLPFNFY